MEDLKRLVKTQRDLIVSQQQCIFNLKHQLGAAKHEGALQVYKLWQEGMDLLSGLDIKMGCQLTTRQYDMIRYILSHEMGENDRWKIRTIPCMNMAVPTLPTLKQIRAVGDAALASLGLKSMENCQGVCFDVDLIMGIALAKSQGWKDTAGKRHMQVVADAHNLFRRTSLTNGCVRALFPNPSYNQFQNLVQVWALAGKDSYENMKEGMRKINDYIVASHDIVFWGGGDAVFISNCLGIGAQFASQYQNCPFCNVAHDKLAHNHGDIQKRTLARLHNLAHLPHHTSPFPFSCPGCKQHFTCQKDVDDDEGPEDTKKAVRTYRKAHEAVFWHRKPLLDIEPTSYVICLLHDLLNNTKHLFKQAILPHVTANNAEQLDEYLNMLNIYTAKSGAAKLSEKSASGKKPPSFTGSACSIVLGHFDSIMSVVCEDEWQISEAVHVVNCYIELRNVLCEKSTCELTKMMKADEVQMLADTYVWEFGDWVGDECCAYYHHFEICHLADQIRALPVDILNGSGEGVEKIGQCRKKAGTRTNHSTGGERKKSVGTGYQFTGKCFLAQLMVEPAVEIVRLSPNSKSKWATQASLQQAKREIKTENKPYMTKVKMIE